MHGDGVAECDRWLVSTCASRRDEEAGAVPPPWDEHASTPTRSSSPEAGTRQLARRQTPASTAVAYPSAAGPAPFTSTVVPSTIPAASPDGAAMCAGRGGGHVRPPTPPPRSCPVHDASRRVVAGTTGAPPLP